MDKSVIETLEKCGYKKWQISRAMIVLERGGSVREAERALEAEYILMPDFELELLLSEVRRERVKIERIF